MSENGWAIGIDVGGTKIHFACIDIKGNIFKEVVIPTRVGEGELVITADIVEVARNLLKTFITSRPPPKGIGIGLAGQIEAKTGLIYFAPNLHWRNFPLKKKLENTLQLPIEITNDVRASTQGEWHFGAGQGCDNFVCLFIGTGIGGGIVSQGQLIEGSSNSAGELGHMTVCINGNPCSCGNKGCLEAYAGGWAIAANTKNYLKAHPDVMNSFADLDSITAAKVIEKYREGDALATMMVDEAKEALIAGGITIVNALNPQKIILGGGVLEGLPEIIPWLNSGIRKKALSSAIRALEIVPAKLNRNAGVIGAAAMMFGVKNYH